MFLETEVTGSRLAWPTCFCPPYGPQLQVLHQTDQRAYLHLVQPPGLVYTAVSPHCRRCNHHLVPPPLGCHFAAGTTDPPGDARVAHRVAEASGRCAEGGGSGGRPWKEGVTLAVARRPSILG